ncbi:MAG TPA: hypothetical protein VFW87_24410 [Pirellulales bacterium]|nr:hypothetical protein [Pirellulales bacterium]
MAVQIMELSKGSGFALALITTPATGDAFADEMRVAKQALLDWKAKRGSRCNRVMFTVVCESDHHAAIEEAIGRLYHSEIELAPLLQSVDVDIALLKPGGSRKAEKEYTFKRASSNRKSWWRFW